MLRFCLLVAMMLIAAVSAVGQDWGEGFDDDIEYNCELVNSIIKEYGDQPYHREDGEVLTFAEFHATAAPGCVANVETEAPARTANFRVTVKSSVNLREGAGTSFKLAGQAKPGDILEVVAEDGDWYEIEFGRGTAFIAGWLTTRLPDAIVETDEPYAIAETNCVVLPDSSRSTDMDINFVIAGERQTDVVVDLYAPTKEEALRVDRQLDKTFIDTGDTYVLQVYRWNQWFPIGIYTIEVTIDGDAYKIAWNVAERAEYNVHVYCE